VGSVLVGTGVILILWKSVRRRLTSRPASTPGPCAEP